MSSPDVRSAASGLSGPSGDRPDERPGGGNWRSERGKQRGRPHVPSRGFGCRDERMKDSSLPPTAVSTSNRHPRSTLSPHDTTRLQAGHGLYASRCRWPAALNRRLHRWRVRKICRRASRASHVRPRRFALATTKRRKCFFSNLNGSLPQRDPCTRSNQWGIAAFPQTEAKGRIPVAIIQPRTGGGLPF